MRLSLTCFGFHFTPHWSMTLVAALFFSLFLKCGFWQISRGQEKIHLLSAYDEASQSPLKSWSSGDALPSSYQRVQISGRFLPLQILLDNQHYHHQLGFDVLSLLLLDDGRVILVDRGWIASDHGSRTIFPEYETPIARVTLEGRVWYPSPKSWVLGPLIEKKSANLLLLEAVDPQKLSQVLQKSVVPFMMRLEKKQPFGFVRDWALVSMPPARHNAYAFQWFAMATAIAGLFIGLNVKKVNDQPKT